MILEYIDFILSNTNKIIMLLGFILIIVSKNVRYALMSTIRLFLYKEAPIEDDPNPSILKAIDNRISELEKNISNNMLFNHDGVIDSEFKNHVKEKLVTSLNEHLSDKTFIINSVLSNIKSDIASQVELYLSNTDTEEIQNALALDQELKKKEYSHKNLLNSLEQEARSASMLKMVMINLFVLSTISFLLFNIFIRPTFTTEAYVAIVALYFSLGAFMLYIIRTSHFRSSVLLAIREDERNYYNVIDYLVKTKNGGSLTEHDVDVVRMIMTNRAEREHKAQHPYEVILKGVSGSNIQFKGGKMQLGSKSSSSADA